MNWSAVIWFVLVLVFIFAEAATVALVSTWFAAGALVAMIASLLGAQVWLQTALFLIVSCGLLCAMRPLAKKYFIPKLEKTNIDAVIGAVGIVTVPIDNILSQGQVKLGAMEWTARSTADEKIQAGTKVKVDRVEGVKVFVTPVEVKVG